MNNKKKALEKHKEWKGKIEIINRVKIETKEDLAVAYTPGVAEPCIAIKENVNLSYEYTRRWNTVAVITDGTAVLGLGDIGAEAGMPVMEGKCALFKRFGDIDAIPLCIKSKDVDEIVKSIALFSGSFGGINLEDISGPRCFEIEKKLQELCDIPIFHDDQHGTAIVVIAALENALKIVKKKKNEIKVVVSGAGAAGIAITKLMLKDGYKNIVLSNIDGIIYTNNPQNTEVLEEISKVTNMENEKGSLKDAINNADVFVGVSAPEIMSINMVKSMKKDAIIFALANPVPEIMPESAILGGAKIVATGRSDFPNQVNNVLAFPGIFRGALDSKAKIINDEMKLAAAKALANHINDESLSETCILPSVFDENISKIVGKAVYDAAILTDVCRK